jgi:membrane fusion protein, multidrug efflux system
VSVRFGEYVVNEQEHEASAMRRLWAFVRRRKVALILAALVLGLAVLVVKNIRHPPEQASEARNRFNRGGGGFGGGSGGARNANRNNNGNFQNQTVAVAIATVGKGDIQIRIPALGTVTPLATVTVRTQVNGQLQKIAFKEGQLVKQGDFLAQIDPRPYEAALAQAQGSLRKDRSLLADAKLDLQRFEELIKEDSVAQQQLDTQRALVEQYEGTIETDQAQVKTAQVNLAYTHITSPIAGRIGLRQVDEGNYVTPGDTNGIAVVTELTPITAIFAIPEDNVGAIMQRLRDGAEMQVEAYDRSNANKLAVGKLLTVDNQIDVTTGTVKLRAQFDNKDGQLFPNQFVNIQLLQDTLHDQTVMPTAAVHRGAPNGVNSTFVYRIKEDSTAAVVPVKLGIADGETVGVVSGLSVGDVVVTEGGDRLRDGAPVELPANTPIHAPPKQAATGRRRNGGFRRGSGANSFRPQ